MLSMSMRPFLSLLLLVAALLLPRHASCFPSWTFDHACTSMSWTPTDSNNVNVVGVEDTDLEAYDLVVVVVNDTNVTTFHTDAVHPNYQTLVTQTLDRNETKKVMRVVRHNASSFAQQRVAVLEVKKLGTSLGSLLKSEKTTVESCAVLVPPALNHTYVQDSVTDLLVQLYVDQRYKSSKDEATTKCKTIDLVWPTSDTIPSLDRAKSMANGVFLTKDIVNAPHNVLNTVGLAETAQRLAKESGGVLQCKILELKDGEKRGMGAYLGVARGSETPPKFIHLTYRPKGRRWHKKGLHKLGISGKGLLFDTGGYNIKTMGMDGMKMDCGGAAAILGAARAIADLQPPNVEVHFVIAACENMINERAMVPGDVLVASNGKTIEVGNTDAEGRLTMADALVFVDRELECEQIIELSTLTGACMMALGKVMAGMWTNSNELASDLLKASKATGEKLWRMPMETEYKELLKSKIADIRNIGSARFGGAITAALFLQNFVNNDKPFAHIDIAGPVWSDKTGATGWGARLVTKWIMQQSGESDDEEDSSAVVEYGT